MYPTPKIWMSAASQLTKLGHIFEVCKSMIFLSANQILSFKPNQYQHFQKTWQNSKRTRYPICTQELSKDNNLIWASVVCISPHLKCWKRWQTWKPFSFRDDTVHVHEAYQQICPCPRANGGYQLGWSLRHPVGSSDWGKEHQKC